MLSGWDPGLSEQDCNRPALPSQKPRHKFSSRGSSANGAIDFKFKHYEDINRYIQDYRKYHTYKNTGVLSGGHIYSSSNCRTGGYGVMFILQLLAVSLAGLVSFLYL